MIIYNKSINNLFNYYSEQKYFFPLISSVIELKQKGIVLVDNISNPNLFFIINKSGYSQFIAINNKLNFDNLIIDFLINIKTFQGLPKKLWIYNVSENIYSYFKNNNINNIQYSERTRFSFINKNINFNNEFKINEFNENNISKINEILNLNIDKMFWNSYNDVIQNSLGVFLNYDDEIISVCYAAAISDRKAEIDVKTNEKYRKRGFAKIVTEHFIEKCLKNEITPIWDCYTNNIASVNLALTLGFEKDFSYPFIIIDNN